MVTFMVRRLLLAVFTIIAISILAFLIIHLPPGDYVTTYIAQIASSGGTVSAEEAANLRILYGLDQPVYIQYLRWVGLIARGNFGMAMEYQLPVAQVIGDRLWLTVAVSTADLVGGSATMACAARLVARRLGAGDREWRFQRDLRSRALPRPVGRPFS